MVMGLVGGVYFCFVMGFMSEADAGPAEVVGYIFVHI